MKSNRFKVKKAYAGLASKAEAMRPKGKRAKQAKDAKPVKAKAKTYKGKSLKPGGGGQFAKMRNTIMNSKPKSTDIFKEFGGKTKDQADAIAAAEGRKKYCRARFQKMAAAGKRRKSSNQ